jgi:hypothetical protein
VFTAQAQSLFEKDTVLTRLQDSLPKGWMVQHNDLLFVITRTNPIYKTPANHINEPVDLVKRKTTTDNDSVPAKGRKDTLKFVFRILPKWDKKKYKRIEYSNDTLMKRIMKLEKQYKSGGTKFVKKGTEKVKGDSAIDAYNNKIEENVMKLEKLIVNVPNYCTQYYFLVYCPENIIWNSDNDPRFYDIFPTQAVNEMEKINTLIDELCSSYKEFHKGE